MQIRWTDGAVDELNGIVDFVAKSNPYTAQRIAQAIYEAGESLVTFPHRGRLGLEPGTRELVLAESGHILTYEVLRDAVFILRIHHGAQDIPTR